MHTLASTLRGLVRFPYEYLSRLAAKDEREQMKAETGWEAPEIPAGQDLHTESYEDEQMEVDGDSEETGDFHEAATQHADNMQHKIDCQDWFSPVSTGPFYPDKLIFRNVDHGVTRELLRNYLENICGQDCLEFWYSDDSRHVLATFKSEIDFVTVTSRCQAKPLSEKLLTVCRVPVSNCILVETVSPTIDVEHVRLYFETPRANGGTVLTVKPVECEAKFVVCFKDIEVTDRVLKTTHKLGGQELRIRRHLECLGPSGGRTEPYVFQRPAPLEVTDKDNLKICFLRHSAESVQTFNERLSEVHAHASIEGGVLWVNCTLTESVHRVDLLVAKWREKTEEQLMVCFDLIRLQRIDVPPEIWQEVEAAVEETETTCGDLVLMFGEQRAFVVLNRSSSEGAVFQQLQSIVKVKQEERELKKLEVCDTRKLQKHHLDLLMLSSFLSDVRVLHKSLQTEIKPHEREILFRGQLAEIKAAQVMMYDVIHSASSVVLKQMPDSHTSLLTTDGARDFVGKKLKAAGLCATWECKNEGIVIVYSLRERCLEPATRLIQTAFKTEALSFDDLSSSALARGEWILFEDRLLKENPGILKITEVPRTVFITAVCDIIPAVKEKVRKFVSENAIYSAVFQLSPSRQKFLSIFWEENLTRIAEMFRPYHVCITLINEDNTVLVRGTNKGIELVRMELTSLAKKIKCTKERITRKETVMYLAGLENTSELEPIGWACQSVLSLQRESSDIKVISSNQPTESPQVTAFIGDITALSVDAIVNAANERMAHGGGLAKYIVLKGGDEIQDECYRILQTRGPISEGDVLVSGPGKLPCKAIIHAVGPRYKGGNEGEEQCLRATVLECMSTASARGFTSIAIPAISSGIFGYPVADATRVIVESVRYFFSTNPDTRVRDVRLVDILHTTVTDFKKALASKSNGRKFPVTEQDEQMEVDGDSEETGDFHEGFTKTTTDASSDEEYCKSPTSVTAADANSDEKFCKSPTSVTAADANIDEKFCKSPTWVTAADANSDEEYCKSPTLVTAAAAGGFAACIDSGAALEENPSRDSGHGHRGPGVVTGQNSSPTSASKAVPIIAALSPGSHGAVEVTTRPSVVGISENLSLSGAVAGERSAGISFGDVHGSIQQGDVTGASGFSFGDVRVSIQQGDITDANVDAIVNSTNSRMDLSRGAVSKALRTKCGPDLEIECETKLSDMAERRVVTTAAFNLRCKLIIHLDAEQYNASGTWENAYADVLKEAENSALSSIAVPAIGTGNFKLSPSASAHALRAALAAHSQVGKSVTTVTVVIFDPAMIPDFTNGLKGQGATGQVLAAQLPEKQKTSKRLYFPEAEEKEEVTCDPRTNSVPEVFKIYIYAANEKKNAEVLKTLNSFVDRKHTEKTTKAFDKVPLEKLQEIARKHSVELRQTAAGTVLRGLPKNVLLLIRETKNIIRKAKRKREECMIAKLVQWYYIEESGTGVIRVAYERRENLLIERAYQGNEEKVELTDAHGIVYVVSFKEMRDWAKLDPCNSVKIMRKEIADWASSVCHLPETWEPQNKDQSVKRVSLHKHSSEYKSVEANMLRTASNLAFTIVSIERIQNPELYKKYIAEKTQMEKRNCGAQSEKTLWHGTSSDTVDEINLKGFDRSFCGKNATCYGQGVYFAVSASYSMCDTYAVRDTLGRKHVYQCKVLVGHSTTGSSNMKVLPRRHENIRFDSATDKVWNPCMYVIFSDTQAYPEYLVTFE